MCNLIKPCIFGITLALPIFLSSCSEFVGFGGSVSSSNEGGKVSETLQFQNYRYRIGAAHKATQLGAVGVKRTTGHNVFEIRTIPELSNLALKRSASFTRHSSSEFKMLGSLSLTEVAELGDVEADGQYTSSASESGVFTIYYVANIKELVEQLNSDANAELRMYLSQSKDFRIVTSIVKVQNHSLVQKSNGTININKEALKAISKEGTATASTKETNGAETVEIKDDTEARNAGLQIADGGTYAYEISRLIWDKESSKRDPRVVDLLVDRPSVWYSFSDSNDHEYVNGTNNPRKLRD